MKRRGVKRRVTAYHLGARLGYVAVELECGHEKQSVQGRARQEGGDWFSVWRQQYAYCSRCKP